MKITDVRTILVEVPSWNWVIAPHIRSFGCVLVFLDTDQGLTGESLLWTFGTKRLDVLSRMVLSLKSDLLGEDPHYTEWIWRKLWAQVRFFGDRGISVFSLSTIDRACWDLVGKAAGMPLYKILGAYRDELPAYASGLWLQLSIEELVEDARKIVGQGYRALKMRIGKPRIEEDVARIRAVREAIGPDVELMVDGNQRFTVDHAIRLGRKIEELNIAWLEEPVPAYDFEGSARVAAALDMPIASGENVYTRYGFRQMLEMRAADILMPDLVCVGGVTELLKVAHMAEAYDVPITPHVFPEQSMHMVAASPNGTYVEHMPWFSALYREKIAFQDGVIRVPDRPGFGFTFDPDMIEQCRLPEGFERDL